MAYQNAGRTKPAESSASFKNAKGRLRKGDVRPSIITLLSRQPYTVTELARILKVSKATVSYHIGILQSRRMVQLSQHEHERRGFIRKLYLIEGSPSSPIEDKCEFLITTILEKTVKDLAQGQPQEAARKIQGALLGLYQVLQFVTHTQHVRLIRNFGFNLAKRYVANHVDGYSFTSVINQLQKFYESHDLGVMAITELTRTRGIIRMYDCVECMNSPIMGSQQCHFQEGLIGGVLEAKTSGGWTADETRCKADGATYCEFRIAKKTSAEQV